MRQNVCQSLTVIGPSIVAPSAAVRSANLARFLAPIVIPTKLRGVICAPCGDVQAICQSYRMARMLQPETADASGIADRDVIADPCENTPAFPRTQQVHAG